MLECNEVPFFLANPPICLQRMDHFFAPRKLNPLKKIDRFQSFLNLKNERKIKNSRYFPTMRLLISYKTLWLLEDSQLHGATITTTRNPPDDQMSSILNSQLSLISILLQFTFNPLTHSVYTYEPQSIFADMRKKRFFSSFCML